MNIQKNQRKVSSTKTSVFMLRDHSILSLEWKMEDTLISSTTETWSSRLKMEETPKSGGSTKDHWPSRPNWTTNHGTFKTQEEPLTCKSGALTLTGGNYSNMRMVISSTGPTVKLSMPNQIQKVNQLSLQTLETLYLKNGRLSILTKLMPLQQRESIKISDSMSTDHSTLSQDFQWRESLKPLVPTTWSSRDTSREELPNNSTLTQSPRQSDLNNGRTTLLKSNQMVDQTTLESLLVSTPDGGNSLDLTVLSSSTKRARSLMSKVVLMEKIRTSKFTTSMERSTSNGTSSMLMSIQKSQRRESSTRTSVSMLRETSMLFQN